MSRKNGWLIRIPNVKNTLQESVLSTPGFHSLFHTPAPPPHPKKTITLFHPSFRTGITNTPLENLSWNPNMGFGRLLSISKGWFSANFQVPCYTTWKVDGKQLPCIGFSWLLTFITAAWALPIGPTEPVHWSASLLRSQRVVHCPIPQSNGGSVLYYSFICWFKRYCTIV